MSRANAILNKEKLIFMQSSNQNHSPNHAPQPQAKSLPRKQQDTPQPQAKPLRPQEGTKPVQL